MLMLVVSLGSTGCRQFGDKKERAAIAASALPIGTITLINTEENYVLIDGGSLPAPEEGAMLKSYLHGSQTAELQATSVRRRPFIIADIKNGQPHIGDRVEMPRFITDPPTGDVAKPSPTNSPAAAPAVAQ